MTSNHNDFSVPNGDYRQPHPDLVGLFSDDRSQYGYRVEGLNEILTAHLGDAFVVEQDEVDALAGYEEPRTLAEIAAAEQEFLNRVWYVRRVVHSDREDVSFTELEAKYGRDTLRSPSATGAIKPGNTVSSAASSQRCGGYWGANGTSSIPDGTPAFVWCAPSRAPQSAIGAPQGVDSQHPAVPASVHDPSRYNREWPTYPQRRSSPRHRANRPGTCFA